MRASAASACASVFALACNDPIYFHPGRSLLIRQDAMGNVVSDNVLFVLPVRRPSTGEKQSLGDEQRSLKLMKPLPWVRASDISIEVEYTLASLQEKPATVFF